MEETRCLKCEKPACLFFEDSEANTSYFMCKTCGKLWREILGDIPATDYLATEIDMIAMMPTDVFEALTDTAAAMDMVDYLHKCLHCQSIAFEVELGFYRCSNDVCGFEWEVCTNE